MRPIGWITVLAAVACFAPAARAQDAEAIARQLANPIAPGLISVPFQFNVDYGIGPTGDGTSYLLNIQPVIPIGLTENWNLISRTILPLRFQDDIFLEDEYGLGDTVQSFFFSPVRPRSSGLSWGVGPVFLLPTASEDVLGTEKWGAGPTAVAVLQSGGWTSGALVNHIWSFGGNDDRADISQTFLQPFVSYALGGGQALSLTVESTYDWNADQWTVPVNAGYSTVFLAGGQAMRWQIGARHYLEAPQGGPDWGLRSTLTLLFPK
jgi:hypothetical protein